MSVRDYPDVARIYVDMDGVVADFERAFTEAGQHPKQFKLVPGAYVNLHPIPGAVEGIHKLLELGFDVFMLTKIPSENPYAASEKFLWMYKHLPIIEDKIIISADKGAVGTERDFLIDDHPEWANAHSFPGTVIKFGGEPDSTKAADHHPDWSSLVAMFTQRKNYFLGRP